MGFPRKGFAESSGVKRGGFRLGTFTRKISKE